MGAKRKQSKPPSARYRALCGVQVEWYQRHGRYPDERIKADSDGVLYVIGDDFWNLKHPNQREWVDYDTEKVLRDRGMV